jgi:hypothetical protein
MPLYLVVRGRWPGIWNLRSLGLGSKLQFQSLVEISLRFLAGGLSCRGSAIPFFGDSFNCKGVISSVLYFLESKMITGERDSD